MKKLLSTLIVIQFVWIGGCSKGNSSNGGGSSNSSNQSAVQSSYKKGDLSQAAMDGDLTKVRQLVLNGAPINENIEVEGSGNIINPLMVAVVYGHREVVNYLLCKGAEPYGTFETFTVRDLMLDQNIPTQCNYSAQGAN